jgi:hypothetical protein
VDEEIYIAYRTGSDILAKPIAYEKAQGARFEPDAPNQAMELTGSTGSSSCFR